jgi:hypothetical protein
MMRFFLTITVIALISCNTTPTKTSPKNELERQRSQLPLTVRLAQYPFSESAKIELVTLRTSEFADIEGKKARDSTGCNCKTVFAYPLKDIITKKMVLNTAQIDTLTAILFKTDTAHIGKNKGLTKIKNALFFYDKNEKLFARLYIDTHATAVWSFYKGKKEIDFVRPLLGQADDLGDFIDNILK